MAKYWVFTNYGCYEGWKPTETIYSDFREAYKAREQQLGNGNHEVVIFKEVEYSVIEKDAESGEI